MLLVLDTRNYERVVDLADCLHMLPVIIVDNNYSIPSFFWKKFIKTYA